MKTTKAEWTKAQKALFAQGNLRAARIVFRGMISGSVTLGLNDIEWAAENALRDAGVTIHTHDGRWGKAYCGGAK